MKPDRTSQSIEALKDAINRFEQTRASKNPADSFGPLGDAVSWIARLDRDLDKASSKYRECRDKHELGQKVLGHRLVRNLLDHDCETIELVEVVSEVDFPVRLPVYLFELKWKSMTDSSGLKKRDRLLAESHGKHIAGRLARETLREMLSFFSNDIPNCRQLSMG